MTIPHGGNGTCLIGFVPKEMDFLKTFILNVFERKCLVPPVWKDVERDLTTNRVSEAQVRKFLFQILNKLGSKTAFLRRPLVSRWSAKARGYH